MATGTVATVPSRPAAVLVTIPAVFRALKVTLPDEVTPVAAAIAPLLLTWNWLVEPTDNRADGEPEPIPT